MDKRKVLNIISKPKEAEPDSDILWITRESDSVVLEDRVGIKTGRLKRADRNPQSLTSIRFVVIIYLAAN